MMYHVAVRLGSQTFQARKVSHCACAVLTPGMRQPEGTPASSLNSVIASARVIPAHTFGRVGDGGGGGGSDTCTGGQEAVLHGGAAPGAAHTLWHTASPVTAGTSSNDSNEARIPITRITCNTRSKQGQRRSHAATVNRPWRIPS